jgi:hypothetical protein
MIRRGALAAAAAAALGVLGTIPASAAGAPPKADTVASGVNVTTNDGVAGYYSDASGSAYRYLGFTLTTTPTSDNMVLFTDGLGGQLGNDSTGEVAGAGLERTGANTYEVFFGHGTLAGDPGAVTGNPPFTDPDTNPLLGGILPAADVQHLTLDTPVHTGDAVSFALRVYTVKVHHTRRYRVAVQAADLTTTGDTATAVMAIGTRAPYFGQAGVGSQRSLAGLTSPVSTSNELAEFTDVTNSRPYAGGFSDFGCDSVTTQVNSAANSNNGAAAEPNPFAQIDPDSSLSGGCAFATASNGADVTVYEGSPVS